MPLRELPVGDADPENRRQFILWTRDVLDLIVQGETDIDDPIPRSLVEPMSTAWGEAKPLFDDLAIAAANIYADRVVLHGLHGSQLRFKLATIQYWAERVNETARRGLRGKWLDFLQRLLTAIDTLLDSILKALGIGSSVKEVKDAIRDSIKDADDEDD